MSTTTDNLGLFKYDPATDGAKTFNIKQSLNDNWDKLDAAVAAAQAAGDYDAGKSYAVGDYCLHDGTLYRCTTATAGEAWNAAHWAATTLAAELIALFAAVSGKAALTHAAQHASGGTDPITPASIGADPSGSAAAVQTNLNAHTGRKDNPHGVTAAQVGADPSGSAATVQANLNAHAGRTDNPHGVTAAQLGAGRVASGTYTGTGTSGQSNPLTLTFPFTPKIVFIAPIGGSYKEIGIFPYGCTAYLMLYLNGYTTSSPVYTPKSPIATWGVNTVTWYCTDSDMGPQFQLNKNVDYLWVAIG